MRKGSLLGDWTPDTVPDPILVLILFKAEGTLPLN